MKGCPGLVGTVPSTISALTAVTLLYVPALGRNLADSARSLLREELDSCLGQCGGNADGSLRRRVLAENRFTGNVPSSISALTALVWLYAPMPCWLPWVRRMLHNERA